MAAAPGTAQRDCAGTVTTANTPDRAELRQVSFTKWEKNKYLCHIIIGNNVKLFQDLQLCYCRPMKMYLLYNNFFRKTEDSLAQLKHVLPMLRAELAQYQNVHA